MVWFPNWKNDERRCVVLCFGRVVIAASNGRNKHAHAHIAIGSSDSPGPPQKPSVCTQNVIARSAQRTTLCDKHTHDSRPNHTTKHVNSIMGRMHRRYTHRFTIIEFVRVHFIHIYTYKQINASTVRSTVSRSTGHCSFN